MDLPRYVDVPLLALLAALVLVVAGAAAVPALRRRQPDQALVSACRVLFVGALLAVLAVVLPGLATGPAVGGVSLVPGAGIHAELTNINRSLGLVNLLGNVLLWTPAAFLAPIAWGWRPRRVLLVGFVLVVVLETAQGFLGRSADVDDVLLNTVGIALGAWLGGLVAARLRPARDLRR
ncbi:VanZ family protein [Cellulomonas citrea]|uniref:VanZ family protein n=1 Tax=Cellulomonas citrea TaxID=1909423 RepID=UPI001F1789B4|nr:VanZ family protein [Cellulomonas citrea]